MSYWQWQAPPPLAPWLLGLAGSHDDGAPEPVRVLPDGGVDLLFSAPAAGGAWTAEVFGPKTRALVVCDRERTQKLAVRLRPGTAARWLGVPAHHVVDRTLPLDALWGPGARELTGRLAAARGRAARRAFLEAALRARGAGLDPPAPLALAAVSCIVASGGRVAARALARGASQLEVALAAGYHDQAHLHRDSRALAGCVPSALPVSPVSDSYKSRRRAAD